MYFIHTYSFKHNLLYIVCQTYSPEPGRPPDFLAPTFEDERGNIYIYIYTYHVCIHNTM